MSYQKIVKLTSVFILTLTGCEKTETFSSVPGKIEIIQKDSSYNTILIDKENPNILNEDVFSNYSVRIDNDVFPISNNNTQQQLDKRRKEFVNWNSKKVPNKSIYDSNTLFLAIHVTPYGHFIENTSEIEFKDNFDEQTRYRLEKRIGPIKKDKAYDKTLLDALNNKLGNKIVIQTCNYNEDNPNDDDFYIYVFKP